ncbi:MAG: type II toxin-antitoxin system HipA family toxin YjjJ [Desulfobacteraceae bacterium]
MQSIIECLKKGPSTSKELQAATGLSQSTVSRSLKKIGDGIVQITEGRSVRYAATCNAFGVSDKIPLSIIGESGKASLIAYVRPLACGKYFIEPKIDNFPSLFLGEGGSGLFDDLPYFLLDLRPQGYVGRQIAKRLAQQSEDFPADPRTWNTNHIGRYLISNGDDLPGNFLFGEPLRLRVRQDPVAVTQKDYPALAEKSIKGDPPGSSAGGEQPKFTAFNRKLGSHVIVKFTPKSDNEISARWRDILITEYHAAKTLDKSGYPTAKSEMLEMDNRLFLESQRFDRIAMFGRSSILSLDIVDREFVGYGGSNWSRVMTELSRQGLVAHQDLQRTRELRYFGQLINNTDMHLGNLSLSIDGGRFRLLPVYDMCSMGFAPKGGELLPFNFHPDLQDTDLDEDQMESVQRMAHRFWEAVASDDRISKCFRDYII